MIGPAELTPIGSGGVVHGAATFEAPVYVLPAGGDLVTRLDAGLYVVRAIRTDRSGPFLVQVRAVHVGAPNPFAGVAIDVRNWYLQGDLSGYATGQIQQWIALDRTVDLWFVEFGSLECQVMIWRVGDCPPEYGGRPVPRGRRLPVNG